jgi:hypothetical protein
MIKHFCSRTHYFLEANLGPADELGKMQLVGWILVKNLRCFAKNKRYCAKNIQSFAKGSDLLSRNIA